jgi:hypothetical protein
MISSLGNPPIAVMSSLATAAQTTRSLEEQRADFANRRFLAMPLAGTVGWMAVGIAGLLLSPRGQVLTLWIATGSIFYLGILFSRLTGENFFARGDRRTHSTVSFCTPS